MLLRRKILIIALLTAFILPQISCAPSGTTVIATAKGSTKIEQKSENIDQSTSKNDGSDIPITGGAVINKNTKVIHIDPECSSVKKMSEKNRLDIDGKEISKYIAEGYKLCSLCGKDYSAYKAKS